MVRVKSVLSPSRCKSCGVQEGSKEEGDGCPTLRAEVPFHCGPAWGGLGTWGSSEVEAGVWGEEEGTDAN